MTTRPFPIKRCGKCGQKGMQLVTTPYAATIEHDGRSYRVEIPARLLTPEEIRQGREKLGLTQKQFANLLGVGEATVSRWETGAQIQQRALDRFLRVCLASPAAVELLRSDFQPSARGA